VPHGQVRVTTGGAIRASAGTVEWVPERARGGAINRQHVNIVEGGLTSFSGPQRNPVPRRQRIGGNAK